MFHKFFEDAIIGFQIIKNMRGSNLPRITNDSLETKLKALRMHRGNFAALYVMLVDVPDSFSGEDLFWFVDFSCTNPVFFV